MSGLYVTFHSVSAALMLEAQLGKDVCRVVPVPRAISSSCGYATEMNMAQEPLLELLLADNMIEWEGVYRAEDDGTFTPVAHYE